MNQEYNFVHKNIGEVPLKNVTARFKNFCSAGGNLPPGGEAHHQMVNRHGPIPESVDVTWTRVSDQKNFHKKIFVKSQIPKGELNKDIIFLYDDDDVRLDWKKH